MITVDGSMMEGGGQLLRMATAYSAVLGEPFRIHSVRAKRSQPGLKPQHLTTLEAAARLTGADVEGASIDSTEVEFRPRAIRGGSYLFDIGTAGSVTLFLQCLVPIAAFADSRAVITVRGGTAVRWSPPTPFLENVVWRAFNAMGLRCSLEVLRHGFYPRGGGEVRATVEPTDVLRAFTPTREQVKAVHGVSLCGRLPGHVALRQAESASRVLRGAGLKPKIKSTLLEGEDATFSPGSLICLWADSMYMGSDALGARGKPAEEVGAEAAEGLVDQIRTGAAVDHHTADHLILPCSLAKGESRFTTSRLTLHTLTAIRLAEMFTDAEFTVTGSIDEPATVACRGSAASGHAG